MKSILIFLLFVSGLAMGEEIKLLTWNVYMFPRPVMFVKQSSRTKSIIEEIKKNDSEIVFLQEAWSPSFRRNVKNNLLSKFPYYNYLGRDGGLNVFGSGVQILSKHPLKVLETYNFKTCAGDDCLADKGVILLELALPSGKKVQFATTHLQAWDYEKAITVRRKQITKIAEILKHHRIEGVPQILIGDLNINSYKTGFKSEFVSTMEILGMKGGPLFGKIRFTHGAVIGCYDNENDGKKLTIDHVLLRDNGSNTQVYNRQVLPFAASIEDVGECPLSDHFAVEATVRL